MRTRFFLSTLFLAAYTAVAIVSGRWLWGKFPTKNLSWQPAAATAVAVGLVAIFFVIRRSAHGAWRDLGLVGVGAVAATLLWKVGAGEGWRATGWLILAAVIGYAIVAVAAAVVGLIQRGRLPWLGQL